MSYYISCILFAGGIYALYTAAKIFFSKERRYMENKLFATQCIGSGIWSLGFAELYLQTDPDIAYYCRSIGLIGTFIYLIISQVLVCHISNIPKRFKYLLRGFAVAGIPVYFMIIQKDQTVYYMSDNGMTYYFKPGIANHIYTAYSVLLGIFILCVTVYMIRFSKIKRINAFGKRFLLVTALMILGMILDTVLPLLGNYAIPGSTLTQLCGTFVLYFVVRADNRSKINVENMSGYIYYSLSMPVLVYDFHHRLQIINDAAKEFFSLEQTSAPQKELSLEKLFEIDGNNIFDFEGDHRNTDAVCTSNRIVCDLSINKILDSYGDIIGHIIIITDLSERIRTMQKLEEAKQEAVAANIAKSTFLANMSHEIRTPMNAIMGFSELILKQDISSIVRSYISDIKNSCQNLLAVINDILDISKLESGKSELSLANYHTDTLFQDIYQTIHVQAKEKGLHFDMNIDPAFPSELCGDKKRIRSILINVLNNAVKYTKAGSVTCLVRLLSQEDNQASIRFTISDTGIGIKENAMEHLFDKFSRFDSEQNEGIEGTGLGLAIVYGSLKMMGGTVSVESTYGKGSVFTIELSQKVIDKTPMKALSVNAPEQISSLNTEELKIRDTKILVVDDNLINLKVITSTLTCYGLIVTTASNGAQAIELCRRTAYDIVFMDQMMPEMDGVEAMQRIRGLSAHYAAGGGGKIVVLTANAITGTRDALIKQGFDEYLSKPVSFKELEDILTAFIPAEKFIHKEKEEASASFEEKKKVLESFVPELECDLGLKHCSDQGSLYLEVLKILHDSGSQQLAQLKDLCTSGKYDDYTIQIHAVKSQLFNAGHTRLGEFAKELESASNRGDYEFITAHMPKFLEKYGEFIDLLGNALQELSKS